MILTIAIPTYNRNEILRTNLEKLLPQLTAECELVIRDNCSPTPVARTLSGLLKEFLACPVRIVRNGANIGGNANALRCFEECETRWLWVLGDDDEVLPDAVATILTAIRDHGDCTFLNFSSPVHPRTQMIATAGLAEFIRTLDSFGNALFISAGVYRADDLKKNLRLGHHYAYSMAPHFVTLLASLGTHGRCCLLPQQITHWEPNTRGDHWSSLDVALGAMTMMELPIPFELKRILAFKMRETVGMPDCFAGLFWCYVLAGGEPGYARYLFDQLCARNMPLIPSWPKRVRLSFQRLWLNLPYRVLLAMYALRHPIRRRPDLQTLRRYWSPLCGTTAGSTMWSSMDSRGLPERDGRESCDTADDEQASVTR